MTVALNIIKCSIFSSELISKNILTHHYDVSQKLSFLEEKDSSVAIS